MSPPRHARTPFGLNMTPMIDVVFQLLIFFVCTVEFQKSEELLEANLPALGRGPKSVAKTPQELDLGRIEVEVARDRVEVALQGRKHEVGKPDSDEALAHLTKQLQEWTRIDRHIPARIQCKPDVPTGTLLRVYDACLQAGLADVRLASPKDPRNE